MRRKKSKGMTDKEYEMKKKSQSALIKFICEKVIDDNISMTAFQIRSMLLDAMDIIK